MCYHLKINNISKQIIHMLNYYPDFIFVQNYKNIYFKLMRRISYFVQADGNALFNWYHKLKIVNQQLIWNIAVLFGFACVQFCYVKYFNLNYSCDR